MLGKMYKNLLEIDYPYTVKGRLKILDNLLEHIILYIILFASRKEFSTK